MKSNVKKHSRKINGKCIRENKRESYSWYQLERELKSRGSHFFDASSIRFFDSRQHLSPIKVGEKIFFITSEQYHGSDGHDEKRKFTLRYTIMNDKYVNIFEVGKFQEHDTLMSAKKAMDKAILEE